jgi:hypothetical protein
MTLKINITPYFKAIANYYWDEYDLENEGRLTIWEMLEKDYGVQRLGRIVPGRPNDTWVTFPNEEHKTLFILRWS